MRRSIGRRILLNVLLPQLLWLRRLRMNQPAVMLVCLGVIVGMWCERFDIVVISLHRTHLPSAWGNYHGRLLGLVDCSLGTVGLVPDRDSCWSCGWCR